MNIKFTQQVLNNKEFIDDLLNLYFNGTAQAIAEYPITDGNEILARDELVYRLSAIKGLKKLMEDDIANTITNILSKDKDDRFSDEIMLLEKYCQINNLNPDTFEQSATTQT